MFKFPILSTERLGIELFLCVLFLGTVTMGVRFWVHRIEAEARAATIQEMNVKWEQKLNVVATKADQDRAKQQEKYDASVKAIAGQRDRALGELRKRASRAEQTITASQTCPAVPACTGDRLAREDAGFLTRYAALAAGQQQQLIEARGGFATCEAALRSVTSGQDKGDKYESGSSSGVPGP